MKTIYTLLMSSILICSTSLATAQKNAGTVIPSMGGTYANANAKPKEIQAKQGSYVKPGTLPGSYFNGSKTGTVTSADGKTYTVISVNDFSFDGGPISYVTVKKDTLFLQNDQLGKLIKETWNDPKYINEQKPTIIMVASIPKLISSRTKKVADKKKDLKN